MERLDFFIGSQTPGRYRSYIEDGGGENTQVISLKAPPGCGKSEAMQHVAEQLQGPMEVWHCSCDPDGIDGILFSQKELLLIDSEWPHQYFSPCPLIAGTEFALYSCVDRISLQKQKEDILRYMEKRNLCFTRCQSYLQGMRTLMQDSFSLLLPKVRTEKITRLCKKVAAKEFEKQPHEPKEHHRFLSAFTAKGCVFFPHTIHALCDRVYVLYDEFPSIQRLFLQSIRHFLREFGYEFYICFSPLGPYDAMEHILIPKLRLGFITLHSPKQAEGFSVCKTIRCERLIHTSHMRKEKAHYSVQKQTFDSMQKEAISCLQQAADYHEKMMEIYGAFLNINAYEQKMNELDDLINSFLQ